MIGCKYKPRAPGQFINQLAMLYTIYITVQPFHLFAVAMTTYNKYNYTSIIILILAQYKLYIHTVYYVHVYVLHVLLTGQCMHAAKMHFSMCTHYTHVYILMRLIKDILCAYI